MGFKRRKRIPTGLFLGGFLVLWVLLSPVDSFSYTYGIQGQNFGGAESDVLNPPRFAGPHALLSVDDQEHFYNQNGDLVRVETDDSLQNTQNTYTVTRKLKEVNQGGAITRFFITATGEKVATVHPDGRRETTPSGHLQFTNDRPRYQYGGDIRTSENSSNLWVSIQDHIGSIVATVDATMPLEKVDRHPFGEIAYHTMGDMGGGYNDRGFHGYEEEGPYTYFPARHLNKNHGRFIQADSVIPHGDVHGHNRYGYTRGNPINRVDPSGHSDFGLSLTPGQVDAISNVLERVPDEALIDVVTTMTNDADISRQVLDLLQRKQVSLFTGDLGKLGKTASGGFYVPGSLSLGDGLIAINASTQHPGKWFHELWHVVQEDELLQTRKNLFLRDLEIDAHAVEAIQSAAREDHLRNLNTITEHVDDVYNVSPTHPGPSHSNLVTDSVQTLAGTSRFGPRARAMGIVAGRLAIWSGVVIGFTMMVEDARAGDYLGATLNGISIFDPTGTSGIIAEDPQGVLDSVENANNAHIQVTGRSLWQGPRF